MTKTRVAVLGGGAGSLSAVWALTATPELRARYDITVWQMGWRLGGKGASGRNARYADRIEEHGLHLWPGFYDNAFSILRDCYDALERPPGAPLARLEDAFEPSSFVTCQEYVDGGWLDWNLDLPENDLIPGTPGDLPTARVMVTQVLQAVVELFVGPRLMDLLQRLDPPTLRRDAPGHLSGLIARTLRGRTSFTLPLQAAIELLRQSDEAHPPPVVLEAVRWLVDGFWRAMRRFVAPLVKEHTDARRAFILADLALTTLSGLVEDDAFTAGLEPLDGEDYVDWLTRHGASDLLLASPWIRMMYDYVFAYTGGDTSRPSISACTANRILYRSLFTYKGAPFWRMQAGMGDTVFAPMYLALQARGVRFAFFHRVDALELDATGRTIARIQMTEQARLSKGSTTYDPLVDVGGLPCWPSEPVWHRLAPRTPRTTDYEASGAAGGRRKTLTVGEDFDMVVCGITLGALRRITPELAAASPPWKRMLDGVGTVQTLALQLWLDVDLQALGFDGRVPTISCGHAQPFDTWADMTHLLPRESWSSVLPPDRQPKNLAYFCGPLREDHPEGAGADPTVHAAEVRRVRTIAETWVQSNLGHLWPSITRDCDPSGIDWARLVDLHTPHTVGAQRLASQYVRANVDPAESYVLSLPGSASARLSADASGFTNLFLAGDWVKTGGIMAGHVEGAVLGGLQGARGLMRQDGVDLSSHPLLSKPLCGEVML